MLLNPYDSPTHQFKARDKVLLGKDLQRDRRLEFVPHWSQTQESNIKIIKSVNLKENI